MTHHALIMFAAGVGIPILAALNARLGANIGGPAAAALVLFTVALVVAGAATALTGPAALARVVGQPWHLFGAGLLIAFYVLSVTWIAPAFGVGNAVFFVLLGQLVSAALIDQFGLFGAKAVVLSPMRVLGLATMAVGLALTQLAGR
ncbi:DMT family transporter [Jannaschia seohaensis]|uniref:Transporter family-2 protein n=1 Tax=Jannaschia seohaensis TaxID=475081 RepID=A0A2Y9C3Z2_9RHOB|nr:DMT family transporter [Jannaschia seohaensis]PWJ22395.1 transporter family-2 protein [Jannaschia seohaensis]SSA38673.1 transporter family-2 protein [Jannaschia seohaensis]